MPADSTSPIGVLMTSTGVPVPILEQFDGGWWVRTPCYGIAAVFDGEPVEHVDVVIDPGHGGLEKGTIGPTGLEEREVNAAIAALVAEELRADGLSVLVTNPDDHFVTLHTRGELITASRPDLAVSIHHNAIPERSSDRAGTLVLHQKDSSRSRRAAEIAFEEIQPALSRLGTTWTAGDTVGPTSRASVDEPDRDYFGLLRFSSGSPTIISEAAYLSEAPEEALMRTDEFRRAEAAAIVEAIRRYRAEIDATDSTEPPPYPSGGEPGDDHIDEYVDPDLG